MNYYYANETNEPIGPRTQEQMQQLHRKGKLRDDSWVFVEGTTEWRPYVSLFPPSADVHVPKSEPTSDQPTAPLLPPIISHACKPPIIQHKRKSPSVAVIVGVVASLMMVIMLAAVSYHYLVQPSTLVATDRDISISFEELETKYGWNGNKGVYNAGKTGGGVRFTNQGSELRGKRGFGNLQIEGSLLITNSGVVLRKGSTLLFR